MKAEPGSLVSAGVLLGAGLGAFVDGIVLHQLLQWHNLLSSVRPPTDLLAMKYNMIWDGVFHLFAWGLVCVGVFRLWAAREQAAAPRSGRILVGALIAGWGAFNFLEGLIDHQLLGIHHVHPGTNQLAWDLAFLGFGLAQLALGWVLISSRERATG